MNSVVESLVKEGLPLISGLSREMYDVLPEEFYYMSYGSNLCMDRFMCYIAGGKPERSSRTYLGCRDRSAPRESFGVAFEGAIYYANDAPQWGGGGFLFADFDEPDLSLGRVHLITREQFIDVVSQECGFEAGGVDVDLDKLLKVGSLEDYSLLYGHTVYVGSLNHLPVISFTTSFSVADVANGNAGFRFNSPSDAYDNVVRRGVEETFDLDDVMIEQYMQGTLGYLS